MKSVSQTLTMSSCFSNSRRGSFLAVAIEVKRPGEGLTPAQVDWAKRLVAQFDGLQSLMVANLEDLMSVEGIGEQRARTVRESLSRMAETSLLERFM